VVRHRRLILWLLTSLVSVTACQADQPEPLVSPLDSPITAPSAADVASLIPTGSVPVDEPFVFDFDGDHVAEIAVAFTASGEQPGGGVVVGRVSGSGYSPMWQAQLPPDVKVTEFKARNMLADSTFVLLAFGQIPGTAKHPLYVYKWGQDGFYQLRPKGGKLDGQESFMSDYWPATLGDVDDDSVMEIVPTYDFDPQAEYLEPLVYQWDGIQFSYTDFYIIAPRFKPGK